MNVDDGLEGTRWIRGLGPARLPAAAYSLLPNLKKALFFAIGEGSRMFDRLFRTHQWPNVFVSDAWEAPACHRRCCERCPGGGSEPPTSAPRSDFMTQSLFLSIDFCRGHGISPLRITRLSEYFAGRSWPNLSRGIFFFVFSLEV